MKPIFLSLLASGFIFSIKSLVGFLTGSLSILSEAVHSFVDLLSAFGSLYSISVNNQKLSIKIEIAIITLGSLWILKEVLASESHIVNTIPGIIVTIVSAVIYFLVFKINHKNHSHSLAVRANLYHIASDIGSSILVLIGLVAQLITGLAVIDKIVAILIVIWLFYLVLRLLKELFKA